MQLQQRLLRFTLSTATIVSTAVITNAVAPVLNGLTPAVQAQTTSGTTLYYNNFENGTASGWTPNGGTWDIYQASGNSKEYRHASQGDNFSLTGNSSWSDYSVQGYVYLANENNGISLLGRVQNPSQFYQLELKKDPSTGVKKWWLWKNNKGSWTTLASGNYNYAANTYYLMQLNMRGSNLTASISTDWGATFQTLGSAADSSYATGMIGVKSLGSGGDRFDNILVSQAGPTAYQSPLTITAGGTYSGNWQSLDPNVPAVTILTSDPVVIKNSRLQGRGTLIKADNGGANLTVSNTYGYGLNPNVAGQSPGRFLKAYKPTNIVVDHCYMESTSGIYLNGDTSAPQSVKIRYNRVHNIDGRASDGNGGFSADFGRSEFVELDKVQNGPGIEIAWNEDINEPYKSRVEDNINMYLSSGTSSSPILIHDNYIQGAYPTNPATDGFSGGGIILGDGDATSVSGAAGFVKAYNNQVVSTTNYGIAIAAGHDNQFYNNRIISSGLLPDGTRIGAQNIGSYVWDSYGDSSKGTFYNNFAHDNTIGWVKAGTRNDWWFPDCASGKCTNNTGLPDPITLDTEKAEYQTWQNKLSSNSVKLGPNFAY